MFGNNITKERTMESPHNTACKGLCVHTHYEKKQYVSNFSIGLPPYLITNNGFHTVFIHPCPCLHTNSYEQNNNNNMQAFPTTTNAKLQSTNSSVHVSRYIYINIQKAIPIPIKNTAFHTMYRYIAEEIIFNVK